MENLERLKNLTEKERKATSELIDGLKNLYGNNLSQVILYGSKARGDAESDSDIDILLVLKKMDLKYIERERISELRSRICLKYNIIISIKPVEEKWLTVDYRPMFLHNALTEGIEILI